MSARIKYKINDISKLQDAYPEIVTDKHVVEKVVDKEALYQVIKVQHRIGRKIPGVTFDGEKPAQEDNERVISEQNQDAAGSESPLED